MAGERRKAVKKHAVAMGHSGMSFRGEKGPVCETSRGSRAIAPAWTGSLLVALLVLLLLAGAAVGQTPVVSVDFAAPVTGIKPMTGILHGIGSPAATDPASSFIAPLSPSLWRAARQTNDLYNRITGFGARFEFVTSDVYGYPKVSNAIYLPGRNSSGSTTDWTAYDAFLTNELNVAQANGHIMIWEFWNEPDLTFNDPQKTGSATPGVTWPATQPQFFAAFARFSAAVRARFPSAQYPNVLIAGPSPSSYNAAFLQAFFDYCKDQNVEVNVAVWHEFSADLRLIPSNIASIRANFLNNPAYAALKLKEIHINEFLAGGADQCSPASLLANLYYFEDPQANPDGVCKTCWSTQTTPVVNSCFMVPGTLGDMLSRDGTQPLAIWWAYQRYAASVGSRVASTTTDSHVLPIASRTGPQPNTAQVLVTDYPFQETPPATNAILKLKNLTAGGAGGGSALPFLTGATRVRVRLERIPNTVETGLPALPVVSELDLPISSEGNATLTLPGMTPHEVWVVTLSAPVAGVQPAPATPGGFTAGASDGQIVLNWNAVPGAASYTVTRSAGPGLPPTITYAGLAAPTFTDLNLTDGQTYCYKVAASSSSGSSSIASAEISATPPIPATTAGSYQFNCGASGAVSPFSADAFFFGNYNTRFQSFSTDLRFATNTAPSAVYNSQRNGLLAYVFPGLTPGAPYTLRLHFAETNSAATSGSPTTLAGYRTFNVSVNGAPLLTNFDIAGSAIAAGATNGYGVAVVRQFPVNADANGRLRVHLSGVVNRAQINGIEVIPLPLTAPAAPTSFLATALPGGDVLSWNAAPGATSYQIYRSTTPGAAGTLHKTVTGTAVADPASTGGFFYYRIAALNATGPSALTADIFATLDLVAWKSVQFTAAELENPLVSSDTSTPAGDGLNNLLKYALGLDPHQGTAAPVTRGTTVVGGQTYLTLSYNRSKRASGIQSYVETCSNLTSWAWGPGAAVLTATADQGETERLTWRDTTPITPANPQRFIRLRVAGQ